ncbi:MAG: hypothetical protein ACOX4Q_04860 [Syntrophomonadales bacterium]
MKSKGFHRGLMALLGTALAFVLVSYFWQRGKNGSKRFAQVKRAVDDIGQEVAGVWAD